MASGHLELTAVSEKVRDVRQYYLERPQKASIARVIASSAASSELVAHLMNTKKDSVFLIAAHPTLPLVVSGAGDAKAYLWTTHVHPPRVASELSGHTESVVAGGFTADGKYLVTGDMNGQVRIWRSKAGGEKWEFFTSLQEVDEVVCIKFHPQRPAFAVGAKDGSVWVYELDTKITNIGVLNAHSLPVNDIQFADAQDETKLTIITASDDASIICWNAYQQTTIYHLEPTQLHGEHPWVTLCLSPSGRTFAAGGVDGTLAIIKVDNGALLQSIATSEETNDEEGRSIEAIAWSDKSNLVAVGNVAGQIHLYDVAIWKVRSSLELTGAVTKLYFVPGTSRLIASGYDSSLPVFDSVTGDRIFECQGHNAGVLGFAVQNEGKRIVSAGEEGVCLVFNVDK